MGDLMVTKGNRGRRQEALPLDTDAGPRAPEHSPLPGLKRPKTPQGTVYRGVCAAIIASRGDGSPNASWAGTEALARSLANAMDVALRKGEPYAVAQLAPRLLDVLRDLLLTPASARSDGDDQLHALLADLGPSATVGNPA